MANYKETSLSGVSWVRCRNITITNPIAGTMEVSLVSTPAVPTAYFQEEKVVYIDGAQSTIDVGSCIKQFIPTDIIIIKDPETGVATGAVMTHAELYTVLYSLYIQTALERDATALLKA